MPKSADPQAQSYPAIHIHHVVEELQPRLLPNKNLVHNLDKDPAGDKMTNSHGQFP
jgi:hypothetical protein